MNSDLDPNTIGKQQQNPVVQQAQTTRVEPVRPRTLPAFLDSLVKPDTIGGDLCRYFIFPAIETGLHKVGSAILGHYILGQPIKPANAKGNPVYIYSDGSKQTDYTQFSSGKVQATVIDTNGVSHTLSSEKYTGNTQSVFKLQHYDDSDVLHANPLPWSWADVEAKRDYMFDVLGDIIHDSGGVTVNDVSDAAGLAGTPPSGNKWWWTDLSKMSVQLDPDDPTIMVIRMGRPPKPVS